MMYKYTSIESCKKIVEGQSLKWSCPLDFNDPLDVRRSLFRDFLNTETLFDEFNAEVLRAVLDSTFTPKFENVVTKAIFEWKKKLKDNHVEVSDLSREIADITEGWGDEFVDNNEKFWMTKLADARVLCFSALAPDSGRESPLMWAHYADEHSGVSLEFDLAPTFNDQLREVVYEQEIPEITSNSKLIKFLLGQSEDFLQVEFESLFTTKAKCWEYESEYRLVLIAPADVKLKGDILPFNPCDLTSITFGCRASDWAVRDIVARCRELFSHQILFYKMEFNPKSFDLLRVRI